MTFFSSLFSSKKNAQPAVKSIEELEPASTLTSESIEKSKIENNLNPSNIMTDHIQNTAAFKDLFLDNIPPIEEKKVVEEKPNKLEGFLNLNYLSMGIRDGFEYHSHETLLIVKSRIRSEFQLIVDQAIDSKVSKILEFKNKLVDVGMIPEISQKIENAILALDASIESLKLQKELSSQSEGWVMTALHKYHQGYISGINDWLSAEELLGSIKNI